MNYDGKMSFGDFVFPNNPQQIRITRSRDISEQRLMSDDSLVTETNALKHSPYWNKYGACSCLGFPVKASVANSLSNAAIALS